MRAWLGAPFLGISRWRWLGALLGCVLVALLWRPAMAWLSLLPLLGAPRRVPSVDWNAPDRSAAIAQEAHEEAVERVRVLAAEQAESRAREDAGAHAAAEDDADAVAARVAAMGRKP